MFDAENYRIIDTVGGLNNFADMGERHKISVPQLKTRGPSE